MGETNEMGAEIVNYSETREDAWAQAQKHQTEKNSKEHPHDLYIHEDEYGCENCGEIWKWKEKTPE